MAENMMEIIINAVDSASDVFRDIIGNAEDMASNITESVAGAGSEFDVLGDGASNFNDTLSNIDSSEIQSLADELGMSTEEFERLCSAGANIADIPFDEASTEADTLESEIQDVVTEMNNLNNSAGDVMVAQTFREMSEGIAGSMMEAVNSAGTFNDSIMRASLVSENFGISADEMKNVVSSLSEETGRAGGQIRESFIKAGSRGITNVDSFRQMMIGAGAQATIFGTDIQTMADSMSGLAARASISEKFIANMGLTMDDLGTAMGMTGATADEVKDKWKELDTNQKASVIGIAASMNEGKNANEEYKNSWQGLNDQLDIAKGKLIKNIGNIILPVVIPAMELAQRVLDGVGTAISGLMAGPASGFISILGTLAGGFLIAVTAAGFFKQMLGFLRIEEMMTAGYQALLNIQNVLTGETSLMAALGLESEAGAAGLAEASFFGLSLAELAALWPLALIVGAIVSVVAVVYELGKAFGWWTDVNTMLDAIWDGVQRLWSAFINHPDVQAFIKGVSEAWSGFIGWIQDVITAVSDFFGINNKGNFDIVRGLINAVGTAWNYLTLPIRVVIRIIQTLWDVFNDGGNADGIVSGLSWAWSTFAGVMQTVWSAVEPVVTLIIDTVGEIINIFNDFANGNIDLETTVLRIWSVLQTNLPVILGMIGQLVGQFVLSIGQMALQAGIDFVMNILGSIMQLPDGFRGYMSQTLTTIRRSMSNWIRTGVTNALRFVTRIITTISRLPSRMLTQLLRVVNSIITAMNKWIKTARQKAESVVSTIIDNIKTLPSKIAKAVRGVTSALTKPFTDAWNNYIEPIYDKIKKVAQYIPGLNAAGGVNAAGGLIDFEDESAFNIRTGEYIVTDENTSIDINHVINLILDLKNVPDGIDTNVLIKALKDKTVLRALTENNDFQRLDQKAKDKIMLKVKRARGG